MQPCEHRMGEKKASIQPTPVVVRSSQRHRRKCWDIGENPYVKAAFNGCLIFALFGGGLWQVLDIPDNPGNDILDGLMVAVTIGFIVEVAISCVADRNYPLSIFFFMDILGTSSMIFEMSFLLGPSGKPYTNDTAVEPTLMRTARVAKMAARAGRFLKLAKCLEFIVFSNKKRGVNDDNKDTAEVLSSKLTLSVSTKVSLLTITLVIVVPMFSIGDYPAEDLSLRVWTDRLEKDYRDAYEFLEQNPSLDTAETFANAIGDFRAFYSEVDYYPYKMDGYPQKVLIGQREVSIPGAALLREESEPTRLQNIVILEVTTCEVSRKACQGAEKAAVWFNFSRPKRVEAGAEMGMCLFVIMVMSVVTANISKTMDRLVVLRLERMLRKAREMALVILSLGERADDLDAATGYAFDSGMPDETALLEQAFRKVALITSISLQMNEVDEGQVNNMALEEKGIVVDMMQQSVRKNAVAREGSQSKEEGSVDKVSLLGNARMSAMSVNSAEGQMYASEELVAQIESWNIDTLQLTEVDRERVCLYVFFNSPLCVDMNHGAWLDERKVHLFYKAAMRGYHNVPYHNAMHAVDIMHTVYRFLCITDSNAWASGLEQTALLIAALCHDLGHEGKTNPFLVESRHKLATEYNDASPLENFHCANLFRISKEETTDIFAKLSKEDYKVVRKTCIATILHTDNAHHFEMVKELQTLYEVHSELCEAQAKDPWADERYVQEIVGKNPLVFLQLLLHTADVSNAAKPYDICAAWADRALGEFFLQGDEEKAMGLPVGMLNDREKVNKPSSQHGFINFLVAPLMTVSVKLLPAMHPLMSEMANNMQRWRDVWVNEAAPDADALAKRDEDVRKIVDQAAELRERYVKAEEALARERASLTASAGNVRELPAMQAKPVPDHFFRM